MTDAFQTQSSYDAVAEEYARQIYDELKDKPLDRELLARFARSTAGKGSVCDIGCGPGQVAQFIHDLGVDASGLDLSPGMVEIAKRLNPGMTFQQGDMRKLPFDDNSLAGLTAFYSIIHIPREDVTDVLRELRRVLQPGGLLFMAFHKGDHIIHLDDWWEKPVSVDFTFFLPDEMTSYLREAGFQVDETVERHPYPDIEHPSQRVYIFASKPSE